MNSSFGSDLPGQSDFQGAFSPGLLNTRCRTAILVDLQDEKILMHHASHPRYGLRLHPAQRLYPYVIGVAGHTVLHALLPELQFRHSTREAAPKCHRRTSSQGMHRVRTRNDPDYKNEVATILQLLASLCTIYVRDERVGAGVPE